MRVPTIRGVIDRRILVNYRIEPEALARRLPPPFRPKLQRGFGIGGICLFRLKRIRPRFLPLPVGLSSENAAHRIAVEWEEGGALKEGVYIPRRDTSARLNVLAGGRIFPGLHHRARFEVDERDDRFRLRMQSLDGGARVEVKARIGTALPAGSIFGSIEEASRFFERGSLGYSATDDPESFDGLELRTFAWHVEPLEVEEVFSSYFQGSDRFPDGAVALDCALLMRGLDHEWHAREPLCAAAPR